MVTLRTARLNLIPVTSENATTLWRIMQSAHLREFQDVPRFTREEFERRVAARPKKLEARAVGRFEWIIELAERKRAIGWISLRVGDQARGTAELGYSLLLDHRGFGYASEAASAVCTMAFERSDLRRIEACCVPQNLASRSVLERVGFTELKVQRHGAVVRGAAVDIVIYELPREGVPRRAATNGARAGTRAAAGASTTDPVKRGR
jgi:RimJ/RimL family protein N-acetyltransferase